MFEPIENSRKLTNEVKTALFCHNFVLCYPCLLDNELACRLNQNHEEAAVEGEEEVEVVELMMKVMRKKKVKRRKTVHLLRNQHADQGLHRSSPQDTVRCI